jgi:SAM-dependent methyltransferase
MSRELKNVLIKRVAARALRDVAPRANGRLIDIGCGSKPYRKLFAPYVAEHVGVDHGATIHGQGDVDIVATAYEIPVSDGSFDTVLCTWVLEHLEEPATALAESRRVLRAGGLAIYEVPLFWHLHEEPRDFFRYTRHGIAHLFEHAGFRIESIVALSGFWVTFGQELVYYLYRFNKGPLRFTGLVPLIGLLVQLVVGLLDRLDRAEAWTCGYLVVARAATDGTIGHET